jgi:hypothetical protein
MCELKRHGMAGERHGRGMVLLIKAAGMHGNGMGAAWYV